MKISYLSLWFVIGFNNASFSQLINQSEQQTFTIVENFQTLQGEQLSKDVKYRNLEDVKSLLNQSGEIAIKLCTNRKGIVTYVEFLGIESNIKDKVLIRKFLQAAKNYTFRPKHAGNKEECSRLVFSII